MFVKIPVSYAEVGDPKNVNSMSMRKKHLAMKTVRMVLVANAALQPNP